MLLKHLHAHFSLKLLLNEGLLIFNMPFTKGSLLALHESPMLTRKWTDHAQ